MFLQKLLPQFSQPWHDYTHHTQTTSSLFQLLIYSQDTLIQQLFISLVGISIHQVLGVIMLRGVEWIQLKIIMPSLNNTKDNGTHQHETQGNQFTISRDQISHKMVYLHAWLF